MTQDNTELLDLWAEFYKQRCWDELGELAQSYPKDSESLVFDFQDLFSFDPDLSDDLRNSPGQMLEYASEALGVVDLPVDVDLSGAMVRPTNLPDVHVYGVGELRKEHANQYIGVSGHVARVTECNPKVTSAAFECQRCGSINRIPQKGSDYQEPHECGGCERQGPFKLNIEKSKFVDQRKLQLKQPPEDSANGQGDTITVYLEGDVADPQDLTLENRVGEDVTLFGHIKLEQQGNSRDKSAVFDQYMVCKDYDFERDTDDIEVSEHKDEFMKAAQGDTPYQDFFESMAPDIYPYGRWPLAIRLGAAYLLGGNRVDPTDGSTYRGDIHMCVIGPPGVGKSKFSQNISELSPGCEHRSATGLSSDVGLTAAAVQDDFAEGDGWVLKPGILPRAKHHAILDEADKTGANLNKMNDALEGEQMASIDKGGINAKLKTRVGLLCMANPEGGRWSEYENDGVKEQVDIDESLWSRFDGIVLLEDEPDREQDSELAQHVIENYQANLKREIEDNSSDDNNDAPVSWDAMKAWVKYARELQPQLTREVMNELTDYYVEIRNDDSFSENSHPTARKLEAGIRFSTAFAKIRASETVQMCDVNMAITLSKELLGQTLNGGELDADVFTEAEEKTQRERRERVDTIIDTCGGHVMTASDIADETRIEYGQVCSDLEKMVENGQAEKEAGKKYEIKEVFK